MIHKWVLALLAGAMTAGLAHAQTEYNTRRDDIDEIRNRHYNILIGDMQLDFVGRVSVTYDDNVYRVEDGEEDGVTGRYSLDTGLFWPISPDMLLDLRIDLGYVHKLSGEAEEGFSIRAAETGSFSFDMLVGDNGILSVVDVLTVRSVSEIISGDRETNANYRELENDLGIQYEVDPSPYWVAGARIGRRDIRVLDDSDYDYRNRVTWYGAGNADWKLNEAMRLGPYVAIRMHEFVEDGNNDSDEYEAGLRWLWAITDFTTLNVSGGYQVIDVDEEVPTPGSTTKLEEFTGRIGLDNRLTENFKQGISVAYEHNVSGLLGVNFTQDISTRYYADWSINPSWVLGYGFQWLNSDEKAEGGEEADFFDNSLRLTWLLSEQLSTYAEYRRTDKDSNQESYDRNEMSIGVAYIF